jgi:hypothetical protein
MKIAIGGAWLRADIGGEREARPFQYWASFTNNTCLHLLKRGCTPMQLPAGRSKQWTWIFNYESTRWPPSIWPRVE